MSTALIQVLKGKKQRERAQVNIYIYMCMVRQNATTLKKRPRCPPSPKKYDDALKMCYREIKFIHTNKES